MSTSSPEDLEDGELPSSDDDGGDTVSTTDTTTSACTGGNTDRVDTQHSTNDDNAKPFESSTESTTTPPDNNATRKRPFQSPEPEQHVDDHSPTNKKAKADDTSGQSDDLEDGEIYSDDEEAMYYPDLVKSRSSSSTVKTGSKSDNAKSSPPRRRYRSESRSRSPIPRDRVFGSNRSIGYSNRYDRKTHSPNKGKDHRGGSSWKDHRGGGRSRGKSRGNYEFSRSGGRHDRSSSGGNTGERWGGGGGGGGEQDSSNEKTPPTLTLEVLEERLKKELAIFPTPNVNPCYSLDEFNYPAPPQWYFRAVNAYNKRAGYKPKGHGGGGWRDEGSNGDGYSKVELVSDNLGYNQQPSLGPIVEPSDGVPPAAGNALLSPPPGLPMGASPRPSFAPFQGSQPMPRPPPFRPRSIMGMGPPNMGMRPPNMGMRPPNMGMGQPIMGMRLPSTGLRPPPIMGMGPSIMGTGPSIMGTGPPTIGSESSNNESMPPGMGTGPPPSMGIRPSFQPIGSNVEQPLAAQNDNHSTQQILLSGDQPTQLPIFDSEIFESFPTVSKSSTDDTADRPHPPISDIPDEGNDDDTGDGDLMIAKDEETEEDNTDNHVDTQELSPTELKSSLSVSTIFTKSLGRRGGRKGVVMGSFSTKRGGRSSQQVTKVPLALIVSVDLTKVQLKMASEDHEAGMNSAESDEFNYDDYLDQLNDEEEDEIKPSSTFDTPSFWIDTNPQPGLYSRSNSKENTNSTCSSIDHTLSNDHTLTTDPLDEDFPAICDTTSDTKTEQHSLQSLVNDDVVDNSIMAEEGKKREGGAKNVGGSNQVGGASLKKAERLYWTKQEKIEKQQKRKQQAQQQQPSGGVPLPQQPSQPLPPSGGETSTTQQRLIPPCKYYLQGHCIHGDNCQYNHSIPRQKKREMCKFFLQDACDKGNDCIFHHGDFPCKYFHGRHMCYHGDKCKFSHAPLTIEGYDLLMGVLEPNLRDQVPFPGQPQPMDNPVPSGVGAPSHPSILGPTPPGLLPDPAVPLPPTGGFPPPLQPSGIAGPTPNQPHTHNFIPGPNLVPGHSYSQPQSSDAPIQQPHPHSNPNPHSNPHSQPMPHLQSNPPQVQASGVGDQPLPSKANVSCNVTLPASFETESLFPDEHPQVLPHDLATQLRKVLLDTPTSTSDEDKKKQEEEEKYELYYWENKDTPTSNNNATDSSIVPSEPRPQQSDVPYIMNKVPPITGQFNQDKRPPTTAMPHPPPPRQQFPPPHIERGGVSTLRPSFDPNHGMLGAPPTQPHPPYLLHQGMINPQPSMGSTQNNLGRRLSPDPRMERDPRHDSHDPRSFNQETQAPPISVPVNNTNPYPSHSTSNPFPAPPPSRPEPYTAPHSNVSNTKLEQFNNPDTVTSGYTIPKTAKDTPPPWNSNHSNKSNDNNNRQPLADPRKKYSQFKIKSKSNDTEKKPTSNEPLPELLRDRTILDKPIDPKDLFGSAYQTVGSEGDGTPLSSTGGGAGGISIFGSGSQQHEDSSETGLKYGEIKLRRDSAHLQQPDDNDGNEETPVIIPSYMTHLDMSQDEEGGIDSAFGSLQNRKRRLSELTSNQPLL